MRLSSRGFTLIEILLVIAILAALVGLVFAAVGPAREAARQRVCVSNLHQIGRAVAMYQSDYGGADPVQGVAMDYAQLGLPKGGEMFKDFANTYIKSRAVLICPDYHGLIVPLSGLFTTYIWCPNEDDIATGDNRFSRMVERRGPDTPLAEDDQHNPPITGKEPRWFTKRVIVLRLGQQVQTRIIPIRDNNSADW